MQNTVHNITDEKMSHYLLLVTTMTLKTLIRVMLCAVSKRQQTEMHRHGTEN